MSTTFDRFEHSRVKLCYFEKTAAPENSDMLALWRWFLDRLLRQFATQETPLSRCFTSEPHMVLSGNRTHKTLASMHFQCSLNQLLVSCTVSKDGTPPSDNWFFSLSCLLQPWRDEAFLGSLGRPTWVCANLVVPFFEGMSKGSNRSRSG